MPPPAEREPHEQRERAAEAHALGAGLDEQRLKSHRARRAADHTRGKGPPLGGGDTTQLAVKKAEMRPRSHPPQFDLCVSSGSETPCQSAAAW